MSKYGYVDAADTTAFMQIRLYRSGDYVADRSVSAGMWWQQMPQLVAVLRIQDVIPDPGSEFFPSRIPNSHQRISKLSEI